MNNPTDQAEAPVVTDELSKTEKDNYLDEVRKALGLPDDFFELPETDKKNPENTQQKKSLQDF